MVQRIVGCTDDCVQSREIDNGDLIKLWESERSVKYSLWLKLKSKTKDTSVDSEC